MNPAVVDRSVVVLRGPRAQGIPSHAADVPSGYGAGVNHRNAKVRGAQWAGIDPQAERVHLVVYVQNLGIPRPVKAEINDLVRGDRPRHGSAGQLHARWRDRVESIGAETTSRGRGNRVSGRRGGLQAVRIQVPAGDRQLGIHLVVYLDNEAV